MRIIILTSLLAIALLGAVLAAIGVHGSTLVSACDNGMERGTGLQQSPSGAGSAGSQRGA